MVALRYLPRTGRGIAMAAIVAWGILCSAELAHASPQLRNEMAGIAKDVKQLLDGQNADSIAVGQFTGPANFPASSGPGIAQMLTEELQKLGVIVKPRARLGVKGEYHATEITAEEPKDQPVERRPKLLAIKLKGTVEDSFGKVVADFSFDRNLKGEESVVELLGIPVELPVGSSEKAGSETRDKKIRESLASPSAHIRGTQILESPEAKFGIEVVIDGKPREPKEDDGLAFVKITRGETYAVRLINNTPQEMAVKLLIDGLSNYTFSELRIEDGPRKGQPRFGLVIVEPKSNVTIRGWHRTNEESNAFQVTEYAKSAAATLNHTAKLGTITALFAASWPKDRDAPIDEPGKEKGPGAGDATGFGQRIKEKFRPVERNVGAIRAVVTARYAK
jgi:hypothetical protein